MKVTQTFALALAFLAGTGDRALADAAFEAKAQNAQRVHDLGDLVWALTATCDTGEEIHQRQCRHLRDARVKELSAATLLVDAIPGGFEVGPWSAAKRSVAVTLYACIDCTGTVVAGKSYFITGTSAPATIEGGRVHAPRILDTALAFRDEAGAKTWLNHVGGANIQFLVKVPDKARWQIAGKDGLGLEILGYRVYVPCEGTILVSSPESGPVEADKKACAKATR